MRLVLTTALVLASSAAFASSITTIGGAQPSSPSIIGIRCTDCPAAEPKATASTYTVPELANGVQKTEIIDINGEKKLVRTEAWFGGSPVIHISKLPDWMATQSAVASLRPSEQGSTETAIATLDASQDGVDLEATTSAVEAEGAAELSTVSALGDLSGFELRLRSE